MPDPRVLVVDDNAMSRELAHDVLEHAGFVVREAGTAAEAAEQLAGAPIQIILLDWHLNAATGLEVLKLIPDTAPRPRVLVLTADARPELRQAALDAGADGLMTKPYRAHALQEAVSQLLRQTGEQSSSR